MIMARELAVWVEKMGSQLVLREPDKGGLGPGVTSGDGKIVRIGEGRISSDRRKELEKTSVGQNPKKKRQ
jgi:hypothetical protein